MSTVDRVAKALKRAKLPDWVEKTHVESMVDHTGAGALRVIVVVRSDRGEMVSDGKALNALARKIHHAVEETGVDLLPYTRFTLADEAA